ncbi:hypothetical protein SCHPADRAFT_131170 [Schizopora paradoxa]|uniref:Uncharacterized protein n=1 Tax=Schizopora paradoxa TaxID=27342 RepID=A0A0H2SM15_9AGAM|nr:hypothetical protein SCHPADRAFT_131170 [Schizopora paradoxa]
MSKRASTPNNVETSRPRYSAAAVHTTGALSLSLLLSSSSTHPRHLHALSYSFKLYLIAVDMIHNIHPLDESMARKTTKVASNLRFGKTIHQRCAISNDRTSIGCREMHKG